MERALRLLEVIRCYSVDRVFLHSLVYVLENIEGMGLGYRDCSWRAVSTGMYCEEIEKDLEWLEKHGFIKIVGGRTILADKKGNTVNLAEILKKAVMHYVTTESAKKVLGLFTSK